MERQASAWRSGERFVRAHQADEHEENNPVINRTPGFSLVLRGEAAAHPPGESLEFYLRAFSCRNNFLTFISLVFHLPDYFLNFH